MITKNGNLLSATLGTDASGFSTPVNMGATSNLKILIVEGTFPTSGGNPVSVQLWFRYHDDAAFTPCYEDVKNGTILSVETPCKLWINEAGPEVQYAVKVVTSLGVAIPNTLFAAFNVSMI